MEFLSRYIKDKIKSIFNQAFDDGEDFIVYKGNVHIINDRIEIDNYEGSIRLRYYAKKHLTYTQYGITIPDFKNGEPLTITNIRLLHCLEQKFDQE